MTTRRKLCLALSALAMAGLLAAEAARAHEGHDHAAELPPLPVQAAGPRMEARSADLELLAVLQGGQLLIYLDHFASNAPVTDAKLELESGDWSAQAEPRPDGTYRVAAGPLAAPGKHPLVVTVEAGELIDLLNGELLVEAPPAAEPPAAAAASFLSPAWMLGGVLIISVLGVVALRARRSA